MITTRRHIPAILLAVLVSGGASGFAADPVIWCEYEEFGLMTSHTLMVVYTNGLFRVWKGPQHPNTKRLTQWFYEGTLTTEEQRFLEMWLEITGFKDRPRNRGSSDDERELRLHQNGRTNIVNIAHEEEAELGQVSFFFYALTRRAHGDKNPPMSRVMQRLIMPKERPLALLRNYVRRASERPDLVSEALRFLSRLVTAEEWAGFVKERLQQADGKKRALLLQALTASDYGLQARIPEEHLRALRPLLDSYKTSPEAK